MSSDLSNRKPLSFNSTRKALTVVLLSLTAAACSDLPITDPGAAPTLRLGPASGQLAVGDSVRLTAEVITSDGQVQEPLSVTWILTDQSVGRVSDGVFIAQAGGSATVQARARTSSGLLQDSLVLVVSGRELARLKVSPSFLAIPSGTTQQLVATGYEASGEAFQPAVRWTSSDTDIAQVSASGVVTGRNAGSTYVEAMAQGIVARVQVRVTAPGDTTRWGPDSTAATVLIFPASSEREIMRFGESRALQARVLSFGGDILPAPVTWSSSDPSIASVGSSTGQVRAIKRGIVSISATAQGVRAIREFEVREPVVATLSLGDELRLKQFSTYTLKPVALDSAGNILTSPTLTFTSSDPSVASVDSKGMVQVVGPDSSTATIEVKAVEGGVTSSVKVTVLPPVAETIQLLVPVDTITVGDSTVVSVLALDAGGAVVPTGALKVTYFNPALVDITQAEDLSWSIRVTAKAEGIAAISLTDADPASHAGTVTFLLYIRAAGSH